MDRRALTELFRDRLRTLVGIGGLSRFARETGVDRSALSQFLAPGGDRLPRAETLRAIAAARGVTSDWLLGLSNTPDAAGPMAPSVEIETAFHADGGSPLDRWRREATGAKLRYVPATLPDMLRLPAVADYEFDGLRAEARMEAGAGVLDDARLGDLDVEIAMPIQTLRDMALGVGVWDGLEREAREAQLGRIASLCGAHYPALRLHLYDGRRTFSAPYTVFGAQRAALYLGRSYIVLTAAEQVRALARHFDSLVREAIVAAEAAQRVVEGLRRDTAG